MKTEPVISSTSKITALSKQTKVLIQELATQIVPSKKTPKLIQKLTL